MAAALWALLAALAGPVPGPGPAGAAQVPQVPLLVWSTERSLWAPLAAPAGRVLSEPELRQLLEPGLQRGPRTVLLFLQEQLSLEDFTAFGGVFGNEPNGAFPRLQGALGSAGSALTLPSVAGAAAAALPLTLQRALGSPPPLRLPGGALGGLRLNRSDPESDPGEPTLLLVGLPHGRSGLMGAKEALASNDAVLGEVLQVLQEEQVPYTALFTARRAHEPPSPGGIPGGFGGPRRGLLGVGEGPEPPPPLRWPPQGDPQMLLWARNVSVALRGQQRDLTPKTFGAAAAVDLGGSSWSPREARLVLQYKEVFGETLNITFLLRRSWFPVSGRSWAWLEEIGVTLGGAPPARFRVRGAAAPSPLGWRCGDLGTPGPLLLPLPPLEHSQHWGLRILDLQVQGFNVSGGVFGGASDCAGFFGPGAWMGLISGGLLLGGLLLGGGILLGLRPMDRFDDPRGPPLPVPLGE
ncbi:V-type proton ATPase subunit S1-like isoform X2 [Poecile atricapillus]|uniref:V-type proton ATPase subunit S1-like isoform X2 n=1 Tax=Poecile atricapillus TaxID=48891 RepID=UPI002739418E|nr:V-type proton ATPase subunit S1-like isoform X2 [Poecile atricapillus]